MRRSDWPENLAALLECWRSVPFSWGRHDCAHWALAVLQAVSARNWGMVSITPYHTASGARRYLRRLHCADMAALADCLLGPRCHPQQLQRGDLAAISTGTGPALGVCTGAHIAVMTPGGLGFVPRAQASTGWKI